MRAFILITALSRSVNLGMTNFKPWTYTLSNLMKMFIALFILVGSFVAAAERQFSAVEFYEVLDASNQRDPSWPARLTLHDDLSMSQEKFFEILQKQWRVSYECNGAPVPSNEDLFDGVHDGYRLQEFAGSTSKLFVMQKDGKTRMTSTWSFTIVPLKDGKFRLDYELEKVPQAITVGPVAHIEETDEDVIHGEGYLERFKCPDGSQVKVLLVPDHAQTS